jgi:hypothetical protein
MTSSVERPTGSPDRRSINSLLRTRLSKEGRPFSVSVSLSLSLEVTAMIIENIAKCVDRVYDRIEQGFLHFRKLFGLEVLSELRSHLAESGLDRFHVYVVRLEFCRFDFFQL